MEHSTFDDFQGSRKQVHSDPIVCLPGDFTLSAVGKVPYYAGMATLRQVVSDVKLVEDIPEEARLNWSLEELFQREINWERVHTQLVRHYLKDPRKHSFFNSLTIALLPVDAETKAINDAYGDTTEEPERTHPNWSLQHVGDISIETHPTGELAQIRWHRRTIYPVAIDGQHRLAALQKYVETEQEAGADIPALDTTKVSLLFLVLSEKVGFFDRENRPLIQILRDIFIDLNKNARRVPKTRLILLEDSNIPSLCVRTLLSRNALEHTPHTLPLSLVRWKEDDAKVDYTTGSYAIVSVLTLNDIVTDCLEVPKDFNDIDRYDEREVERYLNGLRSALGFPQGTEEAIASLREHCQAREEPFRFSHDVLEQLTDQFRDGWQRHICDVFRRMEPYRTYWDKAEAHGVLDGMLAQYVMLPEERREAFKRRRIERDDTFSPAEEIDAPLQSLLDLKRNQWAFFVVFQKGLFRSLFGWDRQRENLRESFDAPFGPTRSDFVAWWIEHMNLLATEGVLRTDWQASNHLLWTGIAQTPVNANIQWSNAASRRIADFLTLALWMMAKDVQDVRGYVTGICEDNTQYPRLVQNAAANLRRAMESVVNAQLDPGQQLNEDDMEQRVQYELIRRLNEIPGKGDGG